MARPPKTDYVSFAEAARMLEVSERTIGRMVDRGTLTYRRTPGGQRRIHRSSVEAFMRVTLDTQDNQ